MKKRTTTLASLLVLTVALAAFVTPAWAGNGNGGGNGGENGSSQAAAPPSSAANGQGDSGAPGNSANAPGHSGSAGPGNSASAPGHASQAQQAAESAGGKPGNGAPASASAGSGKDKPKSSHGSSSHGNSTNLPTSGGIRPTNSTSRNFYAPAGSNSTKLYGNGRTAGQIAMANGASASTMLYSPGNSQPHKVVPCGRAAHGNGGGIDVHALKSHAAKECGSDTPPATPGGGPGAGSPVPGAHGDPRSTGVTVTATGSVNSSSDELEPNDGGVAGSSTRQGAGKSGVLGALATVAKGTLPFTGFPLVGIALIALALIGLGVTARGQSRAFA